MTISSDLTPADLLKGDLKLASPPNIYFAIKEILDNPAKGPKDAAPLIEDDAVLSAKLLKIVNSAFYGFPSQITSITRAMSLIGLRELQNLVLGTLIVERFSNLPGQNYSIHDFWARNLRCAILSRELDKLMGRKYVDSAFLCGLMHNIGQLLFYLRLPELARQVELLSQSQIHADSLTLINIERQIIGFDHYHAGAELCRLWKLPEVFIESIRLHAYTDYIGPYSDIAAIIRLADNFSAFEHPYDALNYSGMNLSMEQIDYALEMTNEEFEAIFKIFYPVQ